ncbi:MAG: sialidase family protein [Verrucomicrobiia bacterium]|jgi:predicted neuraminidase
MNRLKNIVATGATALTLVALSGCATQLPKYSGEFEGKSGLLHEEFVFTDVPFPQCHASTLEETKKGLVVAWFGGTHEKHADVGIWVAHQTAHGWTHPIEVANGIQHTDKRYPCWNPVLFQPKKGPLLLFYKAGPSPREWWGMLMTSDDCGRTWSEPRRLPEDILGPIKNKPIQLANGDILCGSSTEHVDNGWMAHFEITSDLGKTWRRIGPVNTQAEFNAIQPAFIQLTDGRIKALCRTQEDVVSEVSSSDGGIVWSLMGGSSLPNPNAGFDTVTLDNDTHVIIYNHTTRATGGRGRLNISVSGDGANWLAALELEREKAEFSYPAIIQTSDGMLHATYTWKRQRIKHVVIDPAKLNPAPMNNGDWPDQRKLWSFQ